MMKRLDEKDLANRRHFEGGFTLIELLVVVIILGILAAVVVFSVGGVGNSGQESACKIDTRILKTANAAYFAQQREDTGKGKYTDQAGLTAGDEPFLSDPSTLHDIVGDNSTTGLLGDPPFVRVTPTVTQEGAKKCLPDEAKPSVDCPSGDVTGDNVKPDTWVGVCTVTPNGTTVPVPYPF
ncbi:MAG: type II secretion system protein [Acidimicrobiia bacterium]